MRIFMNIKNLQKAKMLKQAMQEFTGDHETKRHIEVKFLAEMKESSYEQALGWAKQRIVTAMGGTLKQWQSVAYQPRVKPQLDLI